MSKGTPAISNMIRPGFTMATKYSGAPFPLPIRTSKGFLVMGLSGKILIHNCHYRFMYRVAAILAASICLEVMNFESKDLMPNIPLESWFPLWEIPFMRPFCAFRNLVLLGCNILPIYYCCFFFWVGVHQLQRLYCLQHLSF